MSYTTRPSKTFKRNLRVFKEIPRSDRNRYLSCIPLPKPVKIRLVQEFDSWIVHNGYLWAVERMKVFRDYILGLTASGSNIRNTPTPSWFATNNHGTLKGLWGILARISIRDSKNLKAVLMLINVYTSVSYAKVPRKVLVSQLRTIVKGVNYHGNKPKMHALKPNTVRCMLSRFNPKPVRLGLPISILQVPPPKARDINRLPRDLMEALNPMWSAAMSKHEQMIYHRALGGTLVLDSPKDDILFRQLSKQKLNFQTMSGDLHYSAEPGNKIRYFAAPNMVYQRMMEPLKTGLLSYLQHMPWDCTKNQRKADSVILSQLKRGAMVHSIDLTSATDRFPYWFQQVVLDAVLPTSRRSRGQYMLGKAYASLFHLLAKGFWRSEVGTLRWRIGQPLGLGPSFPLFSLAHGSLLLLLNGGVWRKQFYVLGDDVIILNDLLYEKYIRVLKSWDVDTSPGKSFSSNCIAQFAGKTYTPVDSFWIPKWVEITRTNLIDIAAFWYEGFPSGLRDESLIRSVLALPEPYGLGRNPDGIPLDTRFSEKLIRLLLERETASEKSAKPSHTLSWSSILANDANPLRGEIIYCLKNRLKLNHPARVGLSKPLPVHLMDRTEVSGYPRTRATAQSISFNRYSLGRTQYWNKLFQGLAQDES